MKNATAIDIAVISTYDSDYIRMIIDNLLKKGYYPKNIFLANKTGQKMFKLRSFRRIVNKIGLKEAILRIYSSKKVRYSNGVKKNFSSIHQIAQEIGINIFYYDHVQSGRLLTRLYALNPKIIVLAGCGIVDHSLISIPSLGCINAHPAILPGARGVDVIDWSILNNYPLGVTAHMVDTKVDAGDIINTKVVRPNKNEKYDDFKYRLLCEQAKIMADSIMDVYQKNAIFKKHDLSQSKLFFSITHSNRLKAKRKFYILTQSDQT